MLKSLKKVRLAITLTIAVIAAAGITASAATVSSAASTNLNSFPESYREMVYQLMLDNPDWVFIPVETGLNFSDAVKAEANGESSLVESGVSAWFKNKSKGSYNPSAGKYISKDSGWVAANEAAAAYFMDPRNLLTEKLVFQFECLSYDSRVHTESGVEKVFTGTFMSNTKMTTATSGTIDSESTENYGLKPDSVIEEEKESLSLDYGTYLCDTCWKYFSDFDEREDGLYCPYCGECLVSYFGGWSDDDEVGEGASNTASLTYAQVIINAAEEFNISPYYLASKIVTEIGTTRSGSVTGTNSTYPGIYNFYNIGATSGTDAVLNGLAWASSGTTYQRAWDTEEKSIMGGAEFISEKYISKGQNTIYYQRFNVAANCIYDTYTHQYMTSTYSASTEAIKTYQAYNGMGTLTDAKVFYIPVYNNLPDRDAVVSFNATGAKTGTTSAAAVLRSAADVNSSSIKTIPSGTVVSVISGTVTSAQYGSNNFLRFPYWYKVSCTLSGVNYSGYVCADFVTPGASIFIEQGGSYRLSYSVSGSNSSETVYFESTDYSVASVSSSGVVTSTGEGDCTIYAYTGGGSMTGIRISVGQQSDTGGDNDSGDDSGQVSGNEDRDYSSAVFAEFTDVSGHSAEAYIRYVVYYGLFKGTDITTFSPEGCMTRGMYVTVLGRLAGVDTSLYLPSNTYGIVNCDGVRIRSGPSTSFEIVTQKTMGDRLSICDVQGDWYYVYDGSEYGYIRNDLMDKIEYSEAFIDVDSTQYYAPYIRWAVENDIVHGYGDNTFGPNDQITREQMAVIVYNYAADIGIVTDDVDSSLLGQFTDADGIHSWAQTQVSWAVGNELVEGKDGTDAFQPTVYATRADVSSVMAKFMMKYVEET